MWKVVVALSAAVNIVVYAEKKLIIHTSHRRFLRDARDAHVFEADISLHVEDRDPQLESYAVLYEDDEEIQTFSARQMRTSGFFESLVAHHSRSLAETHGVVTWKPSIQLAKDADLLFLASTAVTDVHFPESDENIQRVRIFPTPKAERLRADFGLDSVIGKTFLIKIRAGNVVSVTSL